MERGYQDGIFALFFAGICLNVGIAIDKLNKIIYNILLEIKNPKGK